MATSYAQFVDYLTYKAIQNGTPLSGTFELTSRCNLDCKMCYIHKRANDFAAKQQELSAQQWIALAKKAQEQGMLLLLLTGGEPFVRRDFFDIYDACTALGLSVSINTNGTCITPEIVERLRKNAPARINITLYGASPETYERLCGDASACERAYQAVLGLKHAGIPVKLNYSVTPYNQEDLQTVCQFAADHELPIQPATYMFPPIRACENGNCCNERLSAQEAAQASFAYDCFRFSADVMVQRCKELLKGGIVTDPIIECQELPTERIRCRAGASAFWVTYHGQMRPCGMMQIPSVSIGEHGFEASWQMIREARQKILIPAACTQCTMRHACESCPATCYAENQDFEVVPAYQCQKTAAYLLLAQQFVERHERRGKL